MGRLRGVCVATLTVSADVPCPVDRAGCPLPCRGGSPDPTHRRRVHAFDTGPPARPRCRVRRGAGRQGRKRPRSTGRADGAGVRPPGGSGRYAAVRARGVPSRTGLAGPPRGRPPARAGLIDTAAGVFSSARLAHAVPRVADCPGCSVACRCCAPPAGRTGSESHSTRRPCVGRTYGNLPGSVSGAPTRHPVGVFPRTAVPGPHPLGWEILREIFVEGVRHARPRGSEKTEAHQVPERYERQDY